VNYIISNNGAGIAVGLVGDKQEAECLANLAYNLYNANTSDEYFSHLIYLPSFKKFKELLVMREYYNEWDKYWESINHYKVEEDPFFMNFDPTDLLDENNPKTYMVPSFVLKFTKAAIRTVNEIISNNVKMENFMQNISNNTQAYSLGTIYTDKQDEDN
jgi:hypothetical protein